MEGSVYTVFEDQNDQNWRKIDGILMSCHLVYACYMNNDTAKEKLYIYIYIYIYRMHDNKS